MAEKTSNNAEATASQPKADDKPLKCANHPQRNAESYDFGGVALALCDECSAYLKDA